MVRLSLVIPSGNGRGKNEEFRKVYCEVTLFLHNADCDPNKLLSWNLFPEAKFSLPLKVEISPLHGTTQAAIQFLQQSPDDDDLRLQHMMLLAK